MQGLSPVVQWLRLCAPNAGGLGSIPGQGTRSHMLQLRVHVPQLKKDPACPNWKIPHAATKIPHSGISRATAKTQCSQIKQKQKLMQEAATKKRVYLGS